MKSREIPWKRAIAEFIVIFAGVTLSLLADDWRQWREDRARESAFLVALEEDLLADSLNLARLSNAAQRTDTLSVWLQRRLEGPPLPADSLGRVRWLFFGSINRSVNSTYAGLKAGGQMYLIEDDRLRALIVDYYESQQQYMLEFYDSFQEISLSWRDAAAAHFYFSPTDEAASFWPDFGLSETSTWRAFSQDPEVRARLGWLGASAGNWAARLPAAFELNGELRDAIRNELAIQ